jgi:ubiquinone biosynthesis monooxygenase Coq7
MRINTSFSDKLLNEFDRFLKIVSNPPEQPEIPTPKSSCTDIKLSTDDTRNIQGLMRINHTGEVCAQALYYGQALLAKDQSTHAHLIEAALEEHNHLCWCQERLDDLESKPSILNPFWYASSFLLGSTAALFGDKVSYGFVIEVEKQVEDHLQEHLDQIPVADIKTKAILQHMKADEIRHGENARNAGGVDLPEPIKKVMTAMSRFMKFLVYRI